MNVNFIVCDDDENVLSSIDRIISKYMMGNQLTYKTHLFNDYDKNFMQIIKDAVPNKIYILDIETPSKSGIDVARLIRNFDMKSAIIFLTSHEELGAVVLRNELMCISFINKFEDYEARLEKSIKKSLELLEVKKIVRFNERGSIYSFDIDNILYVTRDGIERKSIIKTTYTEFKINKTLTELMDMLGKSFVRTHKSCIVNINNVSCVNKNNNTIYFKNGEKIDLLSAKYKKEMEQVG